MPSPTLLVVAVLSFALAAAVFVSVNLTLGRLLRPANPSPEKEEVYECGEEPVGSSFVQFDLRFYVVALLFIVFDVEVALLFPWAVVFGKANQIVAAEQMIAHHPGSLSRAKADDPRDAIVEARLTELLGVGSPMARLDKVPADPLSLVGPRGAVARAARDLVRVAVLELLLFFGVLSVGFAYLWKRGDLDWVRAMQRRVRKKVRPVLKPAVLAG